MSDKKTATAIPSMTLRAMTVTAAIAAIQNSLRNEGLGARVPPRVTCSLSPLLLKFGKAQSELAGFRCGSLDRLSEQQDPVGGTVLEEGGQATDVGPELAGPTAPEW